jgi:hypothetical protein
VLGNSDQFLSQLDRAITGSYYQQDSRMVLVNNFHPTLHPIILNTQLMKKQSVLEFEEHCLSQSSIGSCMYLVTGTRPSHAYPIFYLSQFLTAPSKSHLSIAKHILRSIKG